MFRSLMAVSYALRSAKRHSKVSVALLIGALPLVGCETADGGKDPGPICESSSGGGSAADTDAIEDLFDVGRILEVEITLSPGDWDLIRQEERDESTAWGPDCNEPPSNTYTYVSANVAIDGVLLENVGMRKKGWYSSDSEKPSLKLKFDKCVDGIEVQGYERLTLNNNLHDSSMVRQCLGFRVFEMAGVPAPRCSLAHVVVNGNDLGIYTNVETPKKAFLGRYFADVDGDFFEGNEADFRHDEGWLDRFARQTNDDRSGYGRLPELADSLEGSDDNLVAGLETLVDIDAFLTFWAVEVLIAHLDGYALSAANFYVYDDPTDGVFQFIPWDLDFTFSDEFFEDDDEGGMSRSVYANAQLTRRLVLLPELREQYEARFAELLSTVWMEEDLHAYVDGLEALLASYPGSHDAAAIEEVRGFIDDQRPRITAELEAGASWAPVDLWPPCGGGCDCSLAVGMSNPSAPWAPLLFVFGTSLFLLSRRTDRSLM